MSSSISSIADLETLYGDVGEASLLKEIDRIVPVYRAIVEAAPFATLATCGPDGLDCSPRGDGPGFVRVADEKTLLLPDRRGNNRIDSLRNIVHDPRIALLFLIPGIGETLRVNGRAVISTDPELSGQFRHRGEATQRPFWSSPSIRFSSNVRARSCGRNYGIRTAMFDATACRAPAGCWRL